MLCKSSTAVVTERSSTRLTLPEEVVITVDEHGSVWILFHAREDERGKRCLCELRDRVFLLLSTLHSNRSSKPTFIQDALGKKWKAGR